MRLPNPIWQELVRETTSSSSLPTRHVFGAICAGGGAGAVSELISVCGASRALLFATVPYAQGSMPRFHPNLSLSSACSASSVLAMAKEAYRDSIQVYLEEKQDFNCLNEASNVFGLACTASLVSEQPKKGPHRCFVATHDSFNIQRLFSYEMEKGLRDRVKEDQLCSFIMAEAVRQECFPEKFATESPFNQNHVINKDCSSPSDLSMETLVVDEFTLETTLEDIFGQVARNEISSCLLVPKTTTTTTTTTTAATSSSPSISALFRPFVDVGLPGGLFVYPGSFNPLHEGHVLLLKAAINKYKQESATTTKNPMVVFEIAIVNVDKPALTPEVVVERVKQFHPSQPLGQLLQQHGIYNFAVCVTSKPLFLEKSFLFPHCKFIVGADTLVRLLNPKYYHNKNNAKDDAALNMISCFTRMKENGSQFIVGGRKDSATNNYLTMETIVTESNFVNQLPSLFHPLLLSLPEEEFRVDLSSTDIRSNNQMKK